MEILCCYKISPDYDKVLERDWLALGPEGPDTSYVPRAPGCCDEAALELSLRLRDEGKKRGETVGLTAVTVSSEKADAFARLLYALGFARVVRLHTPEMSALSPEGVSAALAAAFSKERFDLVLCGAESAEGGGETPACLARRLALPCLSPVTDLHLTDGGLGVSRELPGGELRATAAGPLLCAVGNAKHPYLRMATVRQRMAVSDRLPETLAIPAPNSAEPLTLLRLSRPESGRHCEFVPGESCAEKAEALLKLCPEVRRA